MLNNNRCFGMLGVLIGLTMLLNGCASSSTAASKHYLYRYEMISPIANKDLMYKDQYIFIQFKFDESAVRFQMQNVSDAPISIQWRNVSMSMNRRTYGVKNWTTLYSLSSNPPPAVVIPPLGYVRELIMARDMIVYENNKWIEKEMFPTDDKGSKFRKNAIARFKGSRVALTMPMLVGEALKEYTFVFRVSDITPLPDNALPAKKERPPVPKFPYNLVGSSQSIVPIVITTGILGVVVYLLSQKKTPPGDL
jgi:hypothetical protein